MYQVVQYPHPALRWVCKPITKFTPQLKETANKMFEIMYDHKGVGLAANQIGLPWRMFVCDPPLGDGTKKKVFVNPQVIIANNRPRMTEMTEGCLSMPGFFANIIRASRDVRVEAQDLDGKPFIATYSGDFARVILHETDHLNGIVFTDYLEKNDYLNSWLNYLEIQYNPKKTNEEILENLKILESQVV